jgi:cell wall-associated NlpC family hydrolase
VQYLYSQAGVALPRTTYEQAKVGQAIRDPQDLQAGDILLFATEGGTAPTHEGMYIGGGQFIQAPHTGDVVKISSLTDSYYASRFLVGRRVIGNPQPPPAPKN